MDYEAQYKMTTDYVEETFRQNLDILEIYHVCVPFKVVTCASMYQQFWRPWDEEMHANWVRPMPKNCYKKEDFPFYNDEMWDYNFQVEFGRWYHKKGCRTHCLPRRYPNTGKPRPLEDYLQQQSPVHIS